jgi:D-alanyl-D-alanine dipeptidase
MDSSELLESAWAAVRSPLIDRPFPPLIAEPIALAAATEIHDRGEPLAPLTAPGILVQHSYRAAGRQHAVDQQWIRADVLARLSRAVDGLPGGFGIAVFDGWRPLALQRELLAVLAPVAPGLVAPASADPAQPPPHLTGGAVDLTLTWRDEPLRLGTGFDEFTGDTAATAFEHRPGSVRGLRRLLHHSLAGQGLVTLAEEWWHVEFGTRLWSGLTGRPTRYGAATPG